MDFTMMMRWFWYAYYLVLVVEAYTIMLNERYHRRTQDKVDSNTFLNSSYDYLQTQQVMERLDLIFECMRFSPSFTKYECSLRTIFDGLAPLDNSKTVRVLFQFEMIVNVVIDENKFNMTQFSSGLAAALKQLDKNFIDATVVTTLTRPIICNGEYDNVLEHTWPDSIANLDHSVMFPSGKSNVIRAAYRRCASDGWEDVDIVTWTGMFSTCGQNDENDEDENGNDTIINDVNFLCHPYTMQYIPGDEEEIQTKLNTLIEDMVSAQSSMMAIVVGETILSFVDSIMDTALNLEQGILNGIREAIEDVVRYYPPNKSGFKFRASHLAMVINDFKTQKSNDSSYQLQIGLRQSDGTLEISSDIQSKPDLILPIESIQKTASVKKLNVGLVGVYVCEDTFLFAESKNVFSRVYSVLVVGMENATIDDEIMLYFEPEKKKLRSSIFECVFWDYGMNLGKGGWSTKGCSSSLTTEKRVECTCNHLSSFALLTSPWIENVEKWLEWVSFVGCGLAIISLSITLITYLSFKPLLTEISSKILILICMNLLIDNLLYILNASWAYVEEETPKASVICKSVAVVLHYSLLSSLTWMSANIFFIYWSLKADYGINNTILYKLTAITFVLPTLVVIVTAALDFDAHYDLVKDEICWLKDMANIYWFGIPVAVLTAFNIVTILLVIKQIKRISRRDDQNYDIKPIIIQFKGGISIIVLLGFTWVFGFMAKGFDNIVYNFLFLLFNSFLGIFIFLYYCVFNQSRYQWFGCMREVKERTTKVFTKRSTIGGPSEEQFTRQSSEKARSSTSIW